MVWSAARAVPTMSKRGSQLCGALLLLHALALARVSGMQPRVNPRGWQAAKEAERLAAHRVPPTAQSLPDSGGTPAAAAQQMCSLPRRPEVEVLQQFAWQRLWVASAAAFVLGTLCGAVLFAGAQRLRGRTATTLAEQHQRMAAVAPAAAADEQRLEPARAEAEPAQGSTASPKPPAAAEAAVAAAAAGSTLAAAAEAAAAAERREEGAGESPGAAAAAVEGEGRLQAAPAEASEAAVAAAVQELVMQQSSSTSAGDSGSGGGSSGRTAGHPAGPQQEDAEADAPEMILATAASASSGGGTVGAVGAALTALRSEDQADVAAAAQLVLTMCRSMHVDPGQLSRGERLQLIYTMLQAWQAQQARRHSEQMHKLGSEANLLRSEQRDIAAQQAAHKAARDAYRLSLERTADFRRLCSDTLTFGLAVMLAASAYQLYSRGLLAGLAGITSSCSSLGTALGGLRGRWGLWGSWRVAESLACHVLSLGDALLGVAVLLAAPWLLYRSGLMSDYHTMPLGKLLIGLGLVCGLSGFLAVGKLGGSRATWLATWEAWVVAHIVLSATAHRLQRISLRAVQQQQQQQQQQSVGVGAAGQVAAAAAVAAASSMYEQGPGWLPAVMWLGLGVVLPVLAGTLPFR